MRASGTLTRPGGRNHPPRERASQRGAPGLQPLRQHRAHAPPTQAVQTSPEVCSAQHQHCASTIGSRCAKHSGNDRVHPWLPAQAPQPSASQSGQRHAHHAGAPSAPT